MRDKIVKIWGSAFHTVNIRPLRQYQTGFGSEKAPTRERN